MTKPDSGILYFSTENRINISGLANLDNIKFATSLSKLDRKKNDFILMPERVGIDTIKIYKNNKLILKTFFKVVKINDPIAKLVSTSDSVITVNEILGNPYVTGRIPNCSYKMRFNLRSFKVCVVKRGGERLYFHSQGNKLSDECLKIVAKMSTGETLEFEEISTAMGDVGCPRELPDFSVKIR